MTVPEPAASLEPEAPASEARACLNCGETLLGQHCWSCGQEDVDLHRPLRHLAQDAVGDLLNLDTRLLRTLGPLFFRPGFVIREYLAGRRVRFVPPLKMFLLASLVFFGLVALLPNDKAVTYRITQGEAPRGTGASEDEKSEFDLKIEDALRRAQENPKAFQQTVLANMARAFFVLLPFFALLLKLFYWRQDHYYLDHLIFALYHHSFAFLAMTLQTILGMDRISDWLEDPLSLLLWVWILAWLFIALRKVYGGTRWTTFLKLTGLVAIYTFVFAGAMVLMVMVTLWWY